MSARRSTRSRVRRAREQTAPRTVSPRILAGTAFAIAVVVIAGAAAWPIYRAPSYLVLVAVASLVAGVLAAASRFWRWDGWITAAAVAAALLLTGVPLAVPSRLGPPGELLRGIAEVGTGVVVAWKDLVTVDLPVGSYRNLLVPALVVFLVGTCAMLVLSWRDDRAAYAAAPIGLAMISFGLFFGSAAASAPWDLGAVTLFAPVETALGLSGLLTAMLWLAWRAHDERRRALERAAAGSGVRMSTRPSSADRRRAALGAGIIAVASAVAVAVVPFAARGVDRDVLRTAIGPEIDLSAEVSPLARYRALFDDARAADVLFTVTGPALPDRVRLATLDAYDGEVFRSGGSGAVDDARFVRVPSELDPGEGTAIEAVVTIDGLTGVWMPTAGALAGVDFAGGRAAALDDGFYYSQASSAGVQIAGGGLRAGDRYTLHGVEAEAVAVADLRAPGIADGDVVAPDSLREWMDRNVVGSGGQALADAVALLRERGYLSHGLSVTEESVWVTALPSYEFQPSASGHSLARVNSMFTRLLEREVDPRAAESGNYVAAIGDDEQFAVATALVARELGFPSRVVLGARLADTGEGLTTCEEGVCRAQDLAAWTEVRGAGGAWVPVDVTPQYENSPSLDVTEQRDPEVVTDVLPDTVDEVEPPDPVQEDTLADPADDEQAGLDLSWLWPILRVAGIVFLLLLVAFGPFLVVIVAKALRRRGRRTHPAPAVRVSGGWDEYVDAAVDAGLVAPRELTRRELAGAFESASGVALADTADRAVFSDAEVSAADAEAFWRLVDDERRSLRRGRGVWRGLAATVSLRSFLRQLAPDPSARSRFAERGKRRTPGPRVPQHDTHDHRRLHDRGAQPHLADRRRRPLRVGRPRPGRRVPQVRRRGLEGMGAGLEPRRAPPARRLLRMVRAARAGADRRAAGSLGGAGHRLPPDRRGIRLRTRHDGARRAAPAPVGLDHRIRIGPVDRSDAGAHGGGGRCGRRAATPQCADRPAGIGGRGPGGPPAAPLVGVSVDDRCPGSARGAPGPGSAPGRSRAARCLHRVDRDPAAPAAAGGMGAPRPGGGAHRLGSRVHRRGHRRGAGRTGTRLGGARRSPRAGQRARRAARDPRAGRAAHGRLRALGAGGVAVPRARRVPGGVGRGVGGRRRAAGGQSAVRARIRVGAAPALPHPRRRRPRRGHGRGQSPARTVGARAPDRHRGRPFGRCRIPRPTALAQRGLPAGAAGRDPRRHGLEDPRATGAPRRRLGDRRPRLDQRHRSGRC
nr:transglutaminase-like domain-containing protein [Microbacterium hominis]